MLPLLRGSAEVCWMAFRGQKKTSPRQGLFCSQWTIAIETVLLTSIFLKQQGLKRSYKITHGYTDIFFRLFRELGIPMHERRNNNMGKEETEETKREKNSDWKL